MPPSIFSMDQSATDSRPLNWAFSIQAILVRVLKNTVLARKEFWKSVCKVWEKKMSKCFLLYSDVSLHCHFFSPFDISQERKKRTVAEQCSSQSLGLSLSLLCCKSDPNFLNSSLVFFPLAWHDCTGFSSRGQWHITGSNAVKIKQKIQESSHVSTGTEICGRVHIRFVYYLVICCISG